MKRELVKMETVLPDRGEYPAYSLATQHVNTVRLAKVKYALLPGDYVQMSYVLEPGGAPVAIETLRVASVVVADNLEDLLRAHAAYNHGVWTDAGPRTKLWNILVELYPLAFNEDGTDDLEDVSWVAIYFD